MLAREHRLVRSADFTRCVRRGSRGSSRCLTVHLVEAVTPSQGGQPPARTGFVVSKAVGNAVVRNRVQRRLRHLVRAMQQDGALDGIDLMVVRVQPAAASAGSPELGVDLVAALDTARRRAARRRSERV